MISKKMAYQSKTFVRSPEDGYNVLAYKYKEFHKHLDSFDKGLFDRMIPRDMKNMRILDIGAGDGRMYKFFSKKNVETFVALDIAADLLTQHPKAPNIKKVVGDVLQPLTFKNEYFDFLVSYFLLEHLQQLDTLFSEAYRVLKTNGTRFIGHFLQRREVVFKDGKERFKIQQYRWRKEDVINIAKKYFFTVKIQEIWERDTLLWWIFVLKK